VLLIHEHNEAISSLANHQGKLTVSCLSFAESSKLSPLLAFVLVTALHLLIAYALSKICEMVTGAASTSGEGNYSGSHGEEYVPMRPAAKRQKTNDVHGGDDEDDHFYAEPAYDEQQVAQIRTQHVPSFDLPKNNLLFEQVKLALMELTDFTKFLAAKLYYQYFNLHVNPIVSEELDKYSWLLGASNFWLSRVIHTSFYKKNQVQQEIRRAIVYDSHLKEAYIDPHQVC
jgi:hypothetical protein